MIIRQNKKNNIKYKIIEKNLDAQLCGSLAIKGNCTECYKIMESVSSKAAQTVKQTWKQEFLWDMSHEDDGFHIPIAIHKHELA